MERASFENLRIYQLSEEIPDNVWDIVSRWDKFAQATLGKQLIRASDSIGTNIAEGTGRGCTADNRRFAKIARGSLFEVKHRLRRAYKRNLLSDSEIASLKKHTDKITPKISAFINSFDF